MSTLHITHERSKTNLGAITDIYSGIGRNPTIFMRLEVIDRRVRSPISGKLKDLSTILAAYPELTTYIFPSVDGTQCGSGVTHILFPALATTNAWGKDYYKLIDAL